MSKFKSRSKSKSKYSQVQVQGVRDDDDDDDDVMASKNDASTPTGFWWCLRSRDPRALCAGRIVDDASM